MALNRVPAEILVNCLREAHSPEDVGAAIRASPTFLHAFHCQEEAILKSVLQRCMGPDALYQALLITMCPVWQDGDSAHADRAWADDDDSEPDAIGSAWSRKMFFFDMQYRFQSPVPPCNDSLNIHTLTAVCRLRANVNRIIADYVSFTKSVSDMHGPEPALYASDNNNLDRLSKEELERLQGTFLQYELYCRCWGWPYFHSWIERLGEIFLGDFHFMGFEVQPWVREGLVTVHRYVMAKYTAVFQEIVEDFTATINSLSEPNDQPIKKSSHPSVRELLGDYGPKFLLEDGWRSTPDDSFITEPWRSLPEGFGQGYVTICVDNFSRLGLGFLLNMLRSCRQNRRDLVRDVFDIFCPREGSWFPPRESNFVGVAEEFIDDMDPYVQRQMNIGGNSAWKALMSTSGIPADFKYTMYNNIERLRTLGWVFWDDGRLLDLGILHNGNHDDSSSNQVGLSQKLNPYLSTQRLYGERRLRAPILPVLRKRISKEAWAEKIVPQFYTKPHRGFRKPEMRRKPCKSSERLMEVVDLAYQVALDRCQ